MFVGPSDLGGVCPSGVETINKNGVDHCCCGSSSCCWATCTENVPPEDCLPPAAEWKFNDDKGYYEALQATSGTTDDSTTNCNSPADYTYNNVTGIYYKAVKNPKELWGDASNACSTEGATLIEHRNAAEHQVLEEMFSKEILKYWYTFVSFIINSSCRFVWTWTLLDWLEEY